MSFITMIKPASASCNMNCRYCFYYDVSDNRAVKNFGMMDLDTLETIVIKALNTGSKHVTFAFQGGEPTLVGLDFYKKLIEFVNKHNLFRTIVSYAIQTNGYAIDANWAEFFSTNKFLVGISLDGPKEIHNKYRLDHNNKDTFNKVMKSIQILKKHKVDFNILSVVNKAVATHPVKVYNFFKKNNLKYLQFIPCLDPFDQEEPSPYALTPKDYGDFLKKLLDLWYADVSKGEIISIRYFDNLLSMMAGYPPESCDMNGICSVIPIIEADGSVYPCDFYVLDEWKLGNINDSNFNELISSEKGQAFIETSKEKNADCAVCDVRNICRGGCRRHRQDKLNYFCESYKIFYPYAYPKLRAILNQVQKR